jgi:hypothetical protein
MFERAAWRVGAVGAALVFGPAVVAAAGTVSQCRWDNSLVCDGDDPECDYTETAACPDSDVVSMLGECIEHSSQYGRYSTRCECLRAFFALSPRRATRLLLNLLRGLRAWMFADDCEGDNAWGIFVLVLFLMLSATGLFLAYMKYCVQARKDGHEPCPDGTIPVFITLPAEKACAFCETLTGDGGHEGHCFSRVKDACFGQAKEEGDTVTPVGTEAPTPGPAAAAEEAPAPAPVEGETPAPAPAPVVTPAP